MSEMRTVKPGIYKHYKGNEYQVLDIVRHSETEEVLVLYRTCYGQRDLWVRPLGMFTENVKIDGVLKPRFQYVRTS